MMDAYGNEEYNFNPYYYSHNSAGDKNQITQIVAFK